MKKIGKDVGIASWKIDSPLESWLSFKADNSLFWKKMYVLFYKIFDSDYYKKGLNYIDKNIEMFVGNVTAKERERYILDMVYSLHRFGCMFDEYFLFGYENLNRRGRESFITDKIRWDYYARMNDSKQDELFNNKKKTYELFKEFYKRELILIIDKDDKSAFFWNGVGSRISLRTSAALSIFSTEGKYLTLFILC